MSQTKVYFIGAGPGDPELITVKGQRLISEADLIVYAGSLVPLEILSGAKVGAEIVDSAPLALAEICALMLEYATAGKLVARVHTGDPSLYGAVQEQSVELDKAGIKWEIVPGVSAAFAAAAVAALSFTVPELTQTLIFTRLSGRTKTPELEQLRSLAKHKTSMAVYLSAGQRGDLALELREAGLDPATPIVAVYRAGWSNQKIVRTCLETFEQDTQGLERQTVFLILPAHLQEQNGTLPRAQQPVSRLYASEFEHGYRDKT